MTYKFRPQSIGKRYIMRERRRTGKCHTFDTYHNRSRIEWFPIGYKLNKKTISNQFAKLHYLACHAPPPVQKQWRQAYAVFHKKHFGSYKASIRYLNTWTAHGWL